ncbi:MAG: ribosomal-processing cysteine protease Prp, partial [Clostridia bacterium]
MIKIKVFTDENRILGIEVNGHANYADIGKEDIVCSAVSSVIQTAMLGLMQVVGIKLQYSNDDQKGYLNFNLPQKITDN